MKLNTPPRALLVMVSKTVGIFVTAALFASSSFAFGPSSPPSVANAPRLHKDAAAKPKTFFYEGPFEQTVADQARKAAEVFLPLNYSEKESWPLVVMLHGYSGTAEVEDGYYLGLRYRVTSRGFILVTPDGLKNSRGDQFWNATDFCCDFEHTKVDDVSYLQSLIKTVQEKYKVDARRIYLFGHSNGGFMANRLACEAGVSYAGVASLAGGSFKNPSDCRAPQKTAYLQVHAINDGTVAYLDDPKYSAGKPTIDSWLKRNGCTDSSVSQSERNFILPLKGNDTDLKQWNQCESGHPVAFWTIRPGQAQGYKPHVPWFYPNFTEAVLDFLLAQRSQ